MALLVNGEQARVSGDKNISTNQKGWIMRFEKISSFSYLEMKMKKKHKKEEKRKMFYFLISLIKRRDLIENNNKFVF
jgi:hypothetical protein